MEALGFVALFPVMCGVAVGTGKFENFVVNVEAITKINDECKETVDEQKDTINELNAALASNLTVKMEVLEETNANQTTRIKFLEETVQVLQKQNAELEAKNEALNLSLTAIQGRYTI